MKSQFEMIDNKSDPYHQDEIAKIAYGIWLSKDCPIGHAAEHWHEAEVALAKNSSTKTTSETRPSGIRPALDSRAVDAIHAKKEIAQTLIKRKRLA